MCNIVIAKRSQLPQLLGLTAEGSQFTTEFDSMDMLDFGFMPE